MRERHCVNHMETGHVKSHSSASAEVKKIHQSTSFGHGNTTAKSRFTGRPCVRRKKNLPREKSRGEIFCPWGKAPTDFQKAICPWGNFGPASQEPPLPAPAPAGRRDSKQTSTSTALSCSSRAQHGVPRTGQFSTSPGFCAITGSVTRLPTRVRKNKVMTVSSCQSIKTPGTLTEHVQCHALGLTWCLSVCAEPMARSRASQSCQAVAKGVPSRSTVLNAS
jgi:hypothetical protein